MNKGQRKQFLLKDNTYYTLWKTNRHTDVIIPLRIEGTKVTLHVRLCLGEIFNVIQSFPAILPTQSTKSTKSRHEELKALGRQCRARGVLNVFLPEMTQSGLNPGFTE